MPKFEQRTVIISADIGEYSTNHVTDIYIFMYIEVDNLFDNDYIYIYNAYKSRIQKIVNIQKKIVRLMTFKSYLEHTEPIFTELKILNLYTN